MRAMSKMCFCVAVTGLNGVYLYGAHRGATTCTPGLIQGQSARHSPKANRVYEQHSHCISGHAAAVAQRDHTPQLEACRLFATLAQPTLSQSRGAHRQPRQCTGTITGDIIQPGPKASTCTPALSTQDERRCHGVLSRGARCATWHPCATAARFTAWPASQQQLLHRIAAERKSMSLTKSLTSCRAQRDNCQRQHGSRIQCHFFGELWSELARREVQLIDCTAAEAFARCTCLQGRPDWAQTQRRRGLARPKPG